MLKSSTTPTVSREKIVHALYEAAEIEHSLMCTYLYAAFSLRDGPGEGLTAKEVEAVARWRRVILGVAIEEMSHLIAAWNLTAALGAAPRFGRANFPIDPGYLPANLVVRLAPFDEDVVQHFIYLERPHGSRESDGRGFEVLSSFSRTVSGVRLTPTGYDYRTVGEFYEEIARDLRLLASQLGEDALFCGDPTLQLSQGESKLLGATPITDLAGALAAIDHIVLEGEGAPGHRENSHFQRFRGIQDELIALKSENLKFSPAHPCAVNPVLRRPPQPDGHVRIEDREAVETVDLANAAYSLMLRLLAGAYALPSGDAVKLTYVRAAIGLMQALTYLAERAARLPAGRSHPGTTAGVSFTALRDAAPLPAGASAHRFYSERSRELSAAANELDSNDERCLAASEVLGKVAAQLEAIQNPAAVTPAA